MKRLLTGLIIAIVVAALPPAAVSAHSAQPGITQARTIDGSSMSVRYTGDWIRHSLSGHDLVTASGPAELEFRFRGTGFQWTGPTSPRGATANVYIDGVSVGTVDSRRVGEPAVQPHALQA